MVSEGELAERVSELLRSSDLATTTTAAVRRRLEQEFSVDLSDRKAFLRRQVDLFLQSRAEDEADEEEEAAAAAAAAAPSMAEDEAAGEGDEEGSLRSEGSGSESVEDEEEEEEEESRSRRIGKKKVSKMSKESNKRGSGFSKLCSLSPLLQKILGVSEMARPEVVKQLWVYIREKNLQDPGNRRNIKCDETLRELFHVDSINMFQMNKVLSKHIWPFENVASAKSLQKEKQKKQEREGSDEIVPKEKRQKGALSGFLAPLPLSDALVKFLGTGESTLSRSDVVKRMWDYIRKNNLQDPADKRRIICDDKLKELFEVDSFNGFTVPKLLASHYIKAQQ